MKTYNRIISIFIFTGILLFTIACENDKDFLEEIKRDGLTTENAFLNKAQFEALLATNYRVLQRFYNAGDGAKDFFPKGLGTDAGNYVYSDLYNDWTQVNEFDGYSSDWFNWQWEIIKFSNTAIWAAKQEGVIWGSEEEKNAIIAEGRFFRAFAYRNLASVYGGVPIVDTPVTEPKVDFVRETREACYQFAKADLEFARANLPLNAEKPGKVTRAAADHLLAEINISLEDWDGAIAAATRVINGTHGDFELMEGRFGTRADEPGKNIYWDLWRIGNQNIESGNTEALWVAQLEYNTPGGTVNFGRPTTERMMWNRYWLWSKAGYSGSAVDSTGRGVSFVNATNHVNYTIWHGDGGDLRNTEAVIKRKYYFAADIEFEGVSYTKEQLIPKEFLTVREDTVEYHYPNWQKFGTDKHLDGRPDNGYVRDFYVMRLSETHLLRAEAYLGKGQTDKAADDINVIRMRAQAPLATAGDIDIDYILDERLRELYGEEFRLITLGRLGLRYDRTRRFGSEMASSTIQPHNNLLPIPQTVIDRNVGAVIEQNDGY